MQESRERTDLAPRSRLTGWTRRLAVGKVAVLRVGRALREFLVMRVGFVWLGFGVPLLMLLSLRAVNDVLELDFDGLSIAAGALDILGLVLVAVGYSDLRAQFGRETIIAAIRRYTAEFGAALRRPETRVLEAQGGAFGVSGGRARLTVHPGPRTSLHRRVEMLEEKFERMDDAFAAMEDRAEREHALLLKEVRAEGAMREAEQGKVRLLLETATVGETGTVLLGWIWLLTGAILSILATLE